MHFGVGVTTQAVEALIEHLTYANSSDAPVADRQIDIVLTDGQGASAAAPLSFGNGGGLPGLSLGGSDTDALPVFADIDGDGDLDAIVASSNANFFYYENIGTADNPSFRCAPTQLHNPFMQHSLDFNRLLTPGAG